MAECGYLMEREADEIRAAEAGSPCNRKADPFHCRIGAAPTVPSPQACLKRRLMYRKYVWLWLCMWKTQRL